MFLPLRYRIGLVIAFVSCLLSLFSYLTLRADEPDKVSASDTPFTASVVYLNTNNTTASLALDYHPAIRPRGTSTPIPVEDLHDFTLPPLGSRSFTIESLLQRSRNFQGGGIAHSDESIRTTVVLIPEYSANVAAQMIATGFEGEGSTTYHIPTINRSLWGMTSIIAAQNISLNTPITITLNVYNSAGTTVVSNYAITNVGGRSSVYFDLRTLLTTLNISGSAKVTATGPVYVTVAELSENDAYAALFEGTTPATTVYFPSLPCQSYGASGYLAVRNAGSASTTLTLSFYNQDGTPVPTLTVVPTITPPSMTLGVNSKLSYNSCDFVPTNFAGSVKLISSSQPIVALAKVKVEQMYQSAYVGLSTSGCQLSFPFVRWAAAADWGAGYLRSRTYIAIQNVGESDITGDVTVNYLGKDGELVTTHTIPGIDENAKVNSDPTMGSPSVTEFGYYEGHIYGGSVIIQAPPGSHLVAMARVTKNTGVTLPATPVSTPTPVVSAEDYHAIVDADCTLTMPTPIP
jgi:hypothetical protein